MIRRTTDKTFYSNRRILTIGRVHFYSLGAIAPFGVVAAGGAGFAAFRSGLIGGKEEREEEQQASPKKGGKGKKAPVVSKAKAAAAAKAAAKAAALAKKKGGKKTSGGKGTIAVSKPAAAPSEGLPVQPSQKSILR